MPKNLLYCQLDNFEKTQKGLRKKDLKTSRKLLTKSSLVEKIEAIYHRHGHQEITHR